jgi:phosphoglycerol transferase MdoB-like AlkP superfamily enzyme
VDGHWRVALVRWAMQRKKLLGVLASALVLLVCGLNAASMWFYTTTPATWWRWTTAQNFLNSLEENAIIFNQWRQRHLPPVVWPRPWPTR